MGNSSTNRSLDLVSEKKYEDDGPLIFFVGFSQRATINEIDDNYTYHPKFGSIHIDEMPPTVQEAKAIENLEVKIQNGDYSDIVPL